MKLAILQENLLSALTLVLPAVATRSTLPVLSNICLETQAPTGLRLSAMNMEISIATTIGAHIEESGSITLPARLLLDLVKAFPKERIDFELNHRTQTVTLACGRNKATLKGIDAQEFPLIGQFDAAVAIPGANVQQLDLSPATLGRLVQQTAFAAATDESRPILAGIYTALAAGRLTLVAVDGFRLATASAAIEDAGAAAFSANIPAGAYQRLAALIDHLKPDDDTDLHFAFFPERNQLMVKLGGTEMIVQTIEGNYPDYRRIIPNGNATTIQVATADLLKALQIANLFAADSANIVRIEVEPAALGEPAALDLSAQSSESGDLQTRIDIEHPNEDAMPIKMAFNGRFLLQGLKTFDSPIIALNITVPARPILIRAPGDSDPEHLYVLMPMSDK